METCINTLNPQYQELKQASGVSDFLLQAYTRKYLDEFGRYPTLDELPESHSEKYLKEKLKLKENGSTAKLNVLDFTNSETISEATILLNDKFRDNFIDIIELGNDVDVQMTKRPTVYVEELLEDWSDLDCEGELANSPIFLNNAIEKLAKRLGVDMKVVTSEEIERSELSKYIKNAWAVNAFVHNGTIYINSDNAKTDAPLHELMHLFIGSLKGTNPQLYQTLLDSITQLEGFEDMLIPFKDRTMNDAAEEILVDLFAKYITGLNESELYAQNDKVVQDIFYHIDRMLDMMLEGKVSSRILVDGRKVGMSLQELGRALYSASFHEKSSYFSLDLAQQHQRINNIKKDIKKSGYLEEYCS